MDEQYIIDLYNQLGGESKFGQFEDFKSLITSDPSYQKDFHNAFGESTLGSFNDFSSLVSRQQQAVQPKKKDGGGFLSNPIEQTQQAIQDLGQMEEAQAQQQGVSLAPQGTFLRQMQRSSLGSESAPVPLELPSKLEERKYENPIEPENPTEWLSSILIPKDFREATETAGEQIRKREGETPEFLKPSIDVITPEFLNRDASTVKNELEYQLADAGFKFNAVDRMGFQDIVAIAPNGKKMMLSIGGGKVDETSTELKNFIKENSANLSNFEKIQKLYTEENKKYTTQKAYDAEISLINKEADDFDTEQKDVIAEKTRLDSEFERLNAIPEYKRNTPEFAAMISDYEKRASEVEMKFKDLYKKSEGLKSKSAKIEAMAGKYTEMKAESGTPIAYLWNKVQQGLGMNVAGVVNPLIDAAWGFAPLQFLLGKDEYNQMRSEKAEELGIDINELSKLGRPNTMDYVFLPRKEQTKLLNQSVEIDNAIRDDFKKLSKYGEINGEKIADITTMDDVRNFFVKRFGSMDASKEYMNKMDEGFVTGSIGGLAQSSSSMIGPAWMRLLFSYAQATDALDQEMQNDPDLKQLSENEKQAIKGTVGVIAAKLENAGLKGILKNVPFMNNFVKGIVKIAPKNATPAVIRNIVDYEIKNVGVKTLTRVANGFASEAYTGGLQEAANYEVKGIYNLMNEKEMFKDVPSTLLEQAYNFQLDGEYWSNIAKAAVQEGIGGFMITTPIAVAKAFQKDGYQGMSDDRFAAFEAMHLDSGYRNLYEARLKNEVNQGKITSKESEEMLRDYDLSVGLFRSIPPNITSVEDKKVAMDLLVERKKLEDKKDKKDPALVKPIQEKIDAINEKLTKISADALQKQATGEVPVQSEAGVSETMVKGEPQAGPQVTPEQTIISPEESKRKEELTNALNNAPEGSATITIGEATIDRVEAQKELNSILEKEKTAPKTQPTKQTTVEAFTSAPTETKAEIKFTSPEGTEVSLDGNEQVAAKLYDDALATPEAQRTQQQNDIIQKMQPLVAATTPTTVAPTTEAKVEFTEQDRARKAELENAMKNADKRRKNITVGETTMSKADVKAELDALNQKEQASKEPEQKQRTAEQEADFLDQLLNAPRQEGDGGKKATDEDKNFIRQAVDNAVKAISKIFPNVKIVVHETNDDFVKATGDNEMPSGLYVPNGKGGGTIHINLSHANRRTVGHEVFHGILLSGVKNDAEAQRLTKAMLNSVMKSLKESGKNQELLNELEDFASNYDENIQNEEKLAELFGMLADNYPRLTPPAKNVISRFLERLAKLFGLKPMTDKQVIDFMNTISQKVAKGEEITESDLNAFTQMKKGLETPGSSGFVGNFLIPRQRKEDKIQKAQSVKNDPRKWIKERVEDIDIREFEGQSFITNMYDYTNAGVTDLGNGITLNLFGGKNYVPYMMELRGLNVGDVSNLAAFNTKENAEGFIRNSIESGSSLFAPHSGTKKGSWQFQHAIFEELVKAVLNNNIITGKELIETFNQGLIDNEGNYIAPFKKFRKKYGDISNFNKFQNNPLELVTLLDIENNYSPDLRKRLVDLLIANKKFQTAIGIENKEQFYDKIEDPLNKGVVGGELMGIVKFDPTTFKVRKTNPSDIDHHPSFGWTLEAKIEGIYQPTEFYKSYDVTDSYTKYNKKEVVVSKKNEAATIEEYKTALEDTREYEINKKGEVKVSKGKAPFEGTFEDFKKSQFISSNVSSSAGALPKVATFENLTPRQQKTKKEVKQLEQQFPSVRKQISAYHGSPYKFDKFTTDKIGTGEGAQAFGWGLYFTDLKSIAEQYANKLGGYDNSVKKLNTTEGAKAMILDALDSNNGSLSKSKFYLEDLLTDIDKKIDKYYKGELRYSGEKWFEEDLLKEKKDIENAVKNINDVKKEKNVYEVTLHKGKTPDQYTFLEWDKPLNIDNLIKISTGAEKLGGIDFKKGWELDENGKLYTGRGYEVSAEEMYDWLSKQLGGPKQASLFLLDAGIDGVKYPAESISRGATSDTARGFNYVVFDENAVQITARQQKAKNNLQDIVKQARANNISDEGIRVFLKRNGLSDAEIDNLLGTQPTTRTTKLDEGKLPGYDEMMDKVDAMIARQIKRGIPQDKIAKNLDALLRKFDAYTNATDAQKKALEQEARNRIGADQRRAPSLGRILGAFKDITNLGRKDKTAILNNIMKLAKDAANDLANEIKAIQASGKISVNQFKAIQKRFSKVNFSNERSIASFVDYITNVFKDAEYANKLSEANKLRSSLKGLSKNKDKNGELRELAKRFSEIDPAMVENIDDYLDMASKIEESTKGSRLTATGVRQADMVNISTALDYINEAMKNQQEVIKERLANEVQNLMGVDVSDLSYEKLMELVELMKRQEIATGEDKKLLTEQIDEEFDLNQSKGTIIKNAVKKMFDTYSSIIEDMFKTGLDPFVEYDETLPYTKLQFKASDMKMVREFMNMDLNTLTAKEALMAVDALNNFLTNRSTAGMGAVLAKYTARQNAKMLQGKNIIAKALRYLFMRGPGKLMSEQFLSLPMLFERMFKSPKMGLAVSRAMGVNKIINGAAEASTMTARVVEDYLAEFAKRTPNGKAFNDASNIVERGMVAFMSRTIVGTEQQRQKEFNDRKRLIEESIEVLSEGTAEEQNKAAIYQEVYDKLLADAKTIDDVKSKADKTNVDAVDWWVNEWSKHYDDLADASLNYYNTKLDKDVYYTTDRLSKLDTVTDENVLQENESAYHFNNGNVTERKAGSLRETKEKTGLPKNDDGQVTRYVNLSFDSVNASSLYDALTDIKTIEGIKQVKEFQKTKEYKKIVPDGSDRKILNERIALAVRNIRQQNQFDSSEIDKMVKFLDELARFSATLALAGPTQIPKQTVSIAFNTLVNGGMPKLNYYFDKSKREFIQNSGRAIANRGPQSQVQLESINKMMDEAARSTPEKAMKLIKQANELWLKIFLANPDAYIAKASWLTYYEKALKEQGVDTSKIDYNTHEINDEAADYAQMMVDRQQNITDTRLAGEIYAGEKGGAFKKFLTRTLLPLASFRINQHQRFISDAVTLTSKTTSLQDKGNAARSLAAFGVEQAVFKGIGVTLGVLFYMAADRILRGGEEEDEEEKDAKWDARYKLLIKGQATGAVTDVFSPLPPLDFAVKFGFNSAMDLTQDMIGVADEDKMAIYTDDLPSFAKSLGMYGIAIDKVASIVENVNMARTGKFTDKRGHEKYISEEGQEVLKWSIVPSVILNLGLLPGAPEFNNIMGKVKREIQHGGQTLNQRQEEEAFRGHGSKTDFEINDPVEYNRAKNTPGDPLYELNKTTKEKTAESAEKTRGERVEKFGEEKVKAYESKGSGKGTRGIPRKEPKKQQRGIPRGS